MEKEYENIKLHVTLMNTSFKRNYQAKFKERYDASEILKVIYFYKLNSFIVHYKFIIEIIFISYFRCIRTHRLKEQY